MNSGQGGGMLPSVSFRGPVRHHGQRRMAGAAPVMVHTDHKAHRVTVSVNHGPSSHTSISRRMVVCAASEENEMSLSAARKQLSKLFYAQGATVHAVVHTSHLV